MSLLDDVMDLGFTGLFIGIGVAVLAPVVLPILSGVAKPLAKAAVKGGITLYEKGKEAVAEAGEFIEDVYAEAKAELTEEQIAAGGAGAAMDVEQGTAT